MPTPDPWSNNRIQFPRLICEIVATVDGPWMAAVAESMDLEVADVCALTERAHNEWEAIKQGLDADDDEIRFHDNDNDGTSVQVVVTNEGVIVDWFDEVGLGVSTWGATFGELIEFIKEHV